VGVDGVLADVQPARDFLGAQVLAHQAQAFPFARRQPLDPEILQFGGLAHVLGTHKVDAPTGLYTKTAAPWNGAVVAGAHLGR
jgi:hypothetical protein